MSHVSTPVHRRGERRLASPLARRLARERGIDLARLQGSGPRGRIVKRDIPLTTIKAVPERRRQKPPRPSRKPSVDSCRRGLPHLQASPMSRSAPCTSPAATSSCRTTPCAASIAERLTLAKQTIPHFYLSIDCRLDALLESAEAPQRHDAAGRTARLQDLGQRLHHQGARHGATADAARQRHLDRGGDICCIAAPTSPWPWRCLAAGCSRRSCAMPS